MMLSVVIPTINRPHYLQRAIESVITAAQKKQLNSSIAELIIVNDSEQAIELDAYHNDYILIKTVLSPNAPFGGASFSRHHGITLARGELIFILDDDDYFLPNRFEYCVDVYQKDQYVDAIFEPSVRRDTLTGTERIAGATQNIEEPFGWMLNGDSSSHIATGATSFRRECYFDIGGMDLGLRMGEDGELLLRLAYYKKVICNHNAPVVVCERHDTNTSHENNRRPFHNMKALLCLYKNTRANKNVISDQILKTFVQGKFSYLLSVCVKRYSFTQRVFEVLRVAFYYPWKWANYKTHKSLLVALFKINYR